MPASSRLVTPGEYRKAAKRIREGNHPHFLIGALYALGLELKRWILKADVPELVVTARSWLELDVDQESEALDIAAELAEQREV